MMRLQRRLLFPKHKSQYGHIRAALPHHHGRPLRLLPRHAQNDNAPVLYSSYSTTSPSPQDTAIGVLDDNASFCLSEAFLAPYHKMSESKLGGGSPFGFNGLGEVVYRRTYSRLKDDESGENERWHETVERVVTGCFRLQQRHLMASGKEHVWDEERAQRSAQDMYDRIFHMKFLPPGRGLWALGSPITEQRRLYAALNNCFAAETEIITSEGIKRIGSLDGQSVRLLSRHGKWIEAPIRSFGKQELVRLNLHRHAQQKVIYATTNHRWFVTDSSNAHNDEESYREVFTQDLKAGDTLQSVLALRAEKIRMASQGIQHGIAFGSGPDSHDSSDLYLCGKKGQQLTQWFPLHTVTELPGKNGFHVRNVPSHFKHLPSMEEQSTDYLYSFLAGYFAVNGSYDTEEQCATIASKRETAQMVKDICAVLGIETCGIVQMDHQQIDNPGQAHVDHSISLMNDTLTEEFFLLEEHRRHFAANPADGRSHCWTVVSVEQTDRMEKVYCATVPDEAAFALDGNILTGNCAFVSTEIVEGEAMDPAKPFAFLMDMSMLGVGVGFDTRGAGKTPIKGDDSSTEKVFVVPDSRQGWVESVRLLLDSHFHNTSHVTFDYSLIRPEGAPVKGFGGFSSGPESLKELHENIRQVMHKERTSNSDGMLSVTGIVDLMNLIGKCVVSGNLRKSAEIAFGEHDSEEFMDLKNYNKNPQRAPFGWTSNNSLFAKIGMDYGPAAERIKDNGEPGFAWLDNMQRYSRMRDTEADNKDHRVQGANPCNEQSLESYELCCVSGETRILTRSGYHRISRVIGQQVDVWNGVQWSTVRPFIAAHDKSLFRVHLSDGSFLDCTADHRWSVSSPKNAGEVFDVVETQNLKHGDILAKLIIGGYNNGLNDMEGNAVNDAYELGYLEGRKRVNPMPQEDEGYPDWVFEMDRKSTLEFVAGLMDSADVLDSDCDSHIRVAGSITKMRDLQMLLRRVGVNSATIVDSMLSPGLHTYFCQIPFMECTDIALHCRASRYDTPSSSSTAEAISTLPHQQKVLFIEELPGGHTTYCFSEPYRHMGVFGNVLTYQCLVETFPDNHESLDDYLLTLKSAFLYAKTVTLGRTHWEETDNVMQRNRRIGCSMSGIAQFITKHGIEELREWCNTGYLAIQGYDRVLSDWFAVPRSIKTTSIKPSGTVSLLAGATPGMHYPESRFYIRRLRIPRSSELVEPLRLAGYNIEEAVGGETNTLVVEFPIDAGEGIRTVREVSMWEQLSLAAFLQRHWSDNQVSCTVTFDPESEGPQIKHALDYFQYQLKGISFLPRLELGQTVYKQMPYEPITEEQYQQMLAQVRPLDLGSVEGERITPEQFCDADRCELSSKTERA